MYLHGTLNIARYLQIIKKFQIEYFRLRRTKWINISQKREIKVILFQKNVKQNVKHSWIQYSHRLISSMEYFQFSSKILHYLSFFYLQIFLQIQNNTQYKTFINYLLFSSIEEYFQSSISYFQINLFHIQKTKKRISQYKIKNIQLLSLVPYKNFIF